MMPAGYGQVCANCYWNDLFRRRVDISLNALGSSGISDAFSHFASWLLEEIGAHKAALKINDHLDFFVEIDRLWAAFPSHSELISHFGTPRLRRQRLIDRWMSKQGWIEPAPELRENDLECRRIRAMLGAFSEQSVHGRLLAGYRDHLWRRMERGSTSLRSIRMNLRSACGLLEITNCTQRPDQQVLNQFLLSSPGQRASIAGFVRYLRKKYHVALSTGPVSGIKRSRAKDRERQLLRLLEREKPPTTEQWISVALAFFHGLPIRHVERGSVELILRDDESWLVRVNQIDYWIPASPHLQSR